MSDGGGIRFRAIGQLGPLDRLLEDLRLPRKLSRREVEIVAAAARGLDTKATAAELRISPKTVDEFWRRVYRKLSCNSRIAVLGRLFSFGFGQADQLPAPRRP